MNQRRHHFGSFYLRIGAITFGIGSMVYSGLEFGQYFELKGDISTTNYFCSIITKLIIFIIFI